MNVAPPTDAYFGDQATVASILAGTLRSVLYRWSLSTGKYVDYLTAVDQKVQATLSYTKAIMVAAVSYGIDQEIGYNQVNFINQAIVRRTKSKKVKKVRLVERYGEADMKVNHDFRQAKSNLLTGLM